MRDPSDVFRRQFFKWVLEHNKPSRQCPAGYTADPQSLYEALTAKIPSETLRTIGAAIQDGWLVTADDGRGYFVMENAADSPPQPAVYHVGQGKVIPWWELYVQLAVYVRLRAIAERQKILVRMEDRQMDITVWAGDRLLMYVETKFTAAQAKSLLEKMREYGKTGFELDAPDKGNDPLRKAKYLFADACRPEYFGLCAIGYEQLFKIEYYESNCRYNLTEMGRPIASPLFDAVSSGTPPERTHSERLAAAIQRKTIESMGTAASELWLSPGSGQTSFNAYVANEKGKQCLLAGVYKNGRIWSDIKVLSPDLAESLARRVGAEGILVDLTKECPFWRRGDSVFELDGSDVEPVANALVGALSKAVLSE